MRSTFVLRHWPSYWVVVQNIPPTHRTYVREDLPTQIDNRVALGWDGKLKHACPAAIAHVLDEWLNASQFSAVKRPRARVPDAVKNATRTRLTAAKFQANQTRLCARSARIEDQP